MSGVGSWGGKVDTGRFSPFFLGKILDIPVYCTTQNAARLGGTVSELAANFPPKTKEVDKTAFSMV